MLKLMDDRIFVWQMKHGERKVGSIIVADDNGKTHGIRPRWAKVYAVADNVPDIKVGDWVLVKHGRWTRKFNLGDDEGIMEIEYPVSVLMLSDYEPVDDVVLDSMEYGELKR